MPTTAPKGRSLRAKAPHSSQRGPKARYLVLSTTNLLSPRAGTYVLIDALETLIDEGIKVVVVAK